MVCSECCNNLEVFYNLKRAYVDNTNETLPEADCECDASVDLKHIKNNLIKSVARDSMACKVCTKIVGKLCPISLIELKKYKPIVNLLENCKVDVNLSNSTKILSCESCHRSLQKLQNFLMKCLEVEEKIRMYAEMEGADDNGIIDLKKVQEFTFKPTLKQELESCNAFKMESMDGDQGLFAIKTEPEWKCENEEYLESVIKQEEVDIKSEESENDESNGETDQQISTYKNSSYTKCMMCTFKTRQPHRLEQHMLIHKGHLEREKYECEDCLYETVNKYNMKRHRLKHKNPLIISVYKCEVCQYETTSTKYMRRHNLTHKEKEKIDHKECAYETITKTLKNPSSMTMYECMQCTYKAKHVSRLKGHMLIHKDHSERKKYKCNECPFEAITKSAVRRHTLKHTDDSALSVHKCKVCQYETTCAENIRGHISTHKKPSEGENNDLNDCAYETITKTHTNPSNMTMYECVECTYKTKYLGRLKEHMLIHKDCSEREKYKCNDCPFETALKRTLLGHMETHKDRSEREKYKCKDCPYEAMTKSAIRRHTLMHKDPSVVSVHKCGVCQYETIYKDNIRKHVLTHKDPSEKKQYKCKDCAFETSFSTSLTRHLVTHQDPSEIIMHRCELCTYETKHARDLKQHMKRKVH